MVELTIIESPIGPLTLAVRDAGRVCALYFGASEHAVRGAVRRWYPDETAAAAGDRSGTAGVRRVVGALRAYFDGDVHALDGVDVELNGTPFQVRVWNALRKVRAGETASYSEIARTVGASSAVRAVGAANGANPVALIVPCHRIIGANGSLTGYGGGLNRKGWLLAHERGGSFREF